MKRLSEKIAIVTGGIGGIGQAITELFVQEGAKVAIFDMAKKPVAELLERVAATGGQAGFNAVLPGSTRAPMALAAASISPEGSDYIKNLVARHPMKRQAEPLEIAQGVLFLASDEATYITGTHLAIDGGYTAQ
jgi:NAD(P)-dependent dehydrogenase (short-subunit alcohol dehydrogenase family)